VRPTAPELERFGQHLADCAVGSVIERVWRPGPTSLLLEIRGLKNLAAPGDKKPRLYLDLEHGAPWVAVTTRWPETPQAPDRETLELRRYLENQKIVSVGVEAERRLHLGLAGGHALVVQLAGRYPQAGVCDDHGAALCALLPTRALRDDDSPPLKAGSEPEGSDQPRWLLTHGDAAWAAHDERVARRRKADLLTELRRALTRRQRHQAALDADLLKTEARYELARLADLLKTSMHLVKPKASAVTATDWTRDPQELVTIELDPQLTPSGNLERMHARRKKLERQHEALVPQRAAIAAELETLGRLLSTADGLAPQDEALDAIATELSALETPRHGPQAPAERRSASERLPYRVFLAIDGSEILVGRSAKDNDALTFKVARGSDIFLHARDVAGSHVILCHRKKGPPHPEALLDAATLAAHLSKLREDTVVDVLWTEKKHVRKVKGSPGLVQTAATRNLMVRRDPARVERLYRTLQTP
jgi:predicted ribosome quality control (RQC) complex YloA/Tae2 family protein